MYASIIYMYDEICLPNRLTFGRADLMPGACVYVYGGVRV